MRRQPRTAESLTAERLRPTPSSPNPPTSLLHRDAMPHLHALCKIVRLYSSGWCGHGPFGAARAVLVDHFFFVFFQHDTSCEQTLQHHKRLPNCPTQCSNAFGGCMEVIWNSLARSYCSGWRGTALLGGYNRARGPPFSRFSA